jgi:hypothetical protein
MVRAQSSDAQRPVSSRKQALLELGVAEKAFNSVSKG